MSKSINGRLIELQLIADKGALIEYASTGFVAPNRFISRDIIIDFLDHGLIERKGHQATITDKGKKLLEEKRTS